MNPIPLQLLEVEPANVLQRCFGITAPSFTLSKNSNPSQYPTMMKSAILAAILGSAAAFAPAQSGKASTALRAFEDEVRKDIVAICIPMGGRFQIGD